MFSQNEDYRIVPRKMASRETAAKLFLAEALKLDHLGSLFFSSSDVKTLKRLVHRLEVRLWRYAEAGLIKYREFSVFRVEGGVEVVRNLNPFEKGEKRNLRRVHGGFNG